MSESKVGLLLRTVFLLPLDEGGSLSGDEIAKTFDSDSDHSDIAPNLFQPIFAKAQENLNRSAAGVDPSWSEPIGVVEKSANREDLGDIGTAKDIEIVSTNGVKQARYFDGIGALVAVRVLSKVS